MLSIFKKSLVIRATVLMFMLMLLLLVVLLIGNTNLYKAGTAVTIESINASVAVFEKQMSEKLSNISTDLDEIAASILQEDLLSGVGELQTYFASLQIGKMLNQKLGADNVAECYFYLDKISELSIFRCRTSMPAHEKFIFQDYISTENILQSEDFSTQWNITQIDGKMYAIQVYYIGDGFLGCAVKLEDLFATLDSALSLDTTQYVFTDSNDTVIYSSGVRLLKEGDVINNATQKNKMFFSSRNLSGTSLTFSAVKNSKDIYMGVLPVQISLITLGIITVLVAIVNGIFIYKEVLNPVREMVYANNQVQHGNMDYKIQTRASTREFDTLQTSFNKMVSEIKKLKIKSYEDKLELQKQEITFIKSQIRPHFFLNAITTISSLSYQTKNAEIQSFVVSLSAYLRYMITNPFEHATIESEFLAAADYIAMQQIRYPGCIFYMSQSDDDAKTVTIPKLMIQTFIENIFKHAFDPEKMLSIFVQALKNDDNILIIIEDNGIGFNEELIAQQQGEPVVSGEHIGINSMKRMLFLQYGRSDLVRLKNLQPCGARVEIEIPIFRKEQVNENIDN